MCALSIGAGQSVGVGCSVVVEDAVWFAILGSWNYGIGHIAQGEKRET